MKSNLLKGLALAIAVTTLLSGCGNKKIPHRKAQERQTRHLPHKQHSRLTHFKFSLDKRVKLLKWI